MGYAILSSLMDPVMSSMSICRVRQIKNTLRQSTKLLKLDDVNFQGCEAETDQPRAEKVLIWRMTEDNTDKLLEEFSSNPKKFHNEGILEFKRTKMVQLLDTSDLECSYEVMYVYIIE